MSNQAQQIAQLLNETGHAHHQAFLAMDGSDPEWPIWYANYLHKKLVPLMRVDPTKSELVYLLVYLDKKYTLASSPEPWTTYYGDFLAKYDG